MCRSVLISQEDTSMEKINMLHLVTLLLTSGCITLSSQFRTYYLIREPMTWNNARAHCRLAYTDLATVDSKDDMLRLEELTKPGPSLWIGLIKGKTMTWKWSAGGSQTSDQLEYTNWAESSNLNFNCVGMSEDGEWHNVKCGTGLHFVCQGGEESGEIHIIRVVMSWRNAKEYCEVNHGDLVSVRSETENRALHEKLIEAKIGDTFLVWIGLFRDKWTWSDHSMSSSRYWSSSQPNKDGDCVLYNTHSRDWYDRGCASTFGFICYRETVKRRIVMMEIKANSALDFSDAALSESMLNQIQGKLEGVKLKWKVHPDGKIFHKKEKERNEDL